MSNEQFNALHYRDPMVSRILDAGEQCIHRFGIRRTSMSEVARVGKLSRGSIYNHFNDNMQHAVHFKHSHDNMTHAVR